MSETATATRSNILVTEHVTKQFGGLTAVSDVSFTVPERSIVSIIGPNGAGKTTFFNMLTGFYKPTLGRITLEGRNVTGGRPDVIMMIMRPEGLLPERRRQMELEDGVGTDEVAYESRVS